MGRGRLTGKTALITAAGSGIGKATALAYAAEGATVYATDIDDDALAEFNEVVGIERLRMDVTNQVDVDAALERAGPLDTLFNCVGFVHSGTILECEEGDWDRTFDLNVKAMYRLARAAMPAMLERGRGSIINMSSVASSIKGVPNRFAYCASKGAVIGLTKSIATDFVSSGLRCNAICPGTVDTPSLRQRLRETGDYEAAMKAFVARQPMGRLGRAEEIAALAVYLGSDESAFTTGQTFVVDGGWTA